MGLSLYTQNIGRWMFIGSQFDDRSSMRTDSAMYRYSMISSFSKQNIFYVDCFYELCCFFYW